MLRVERHHRIVETLRSRGVVSTEELARLCEASVETIRRDLVELERQQRLTRVHGGATMSPSTGEEAPYTERSGAAREAKEAIGAAAARLVQPGQTLVIDVGTTALEVARALPAAFRGVVATPSLLVAGELAGRPGVEVLVSGGRVRAGDLACSNAQAVAFFADLRADVAFLGSGGIDAATGLTDFHLDEIATRRIIVSNSLRSYVLADSTKIGRVAPHVVCGLDEVDGLITDDLTSAPLRTQIERLGGVVVTP